jgi:hypothetical protein
MDPDRLARLRQLEAGLRRRSEEDIRLAMRVAVLVRLELPQVVIAERLGVPLGDVKRAVGQLREIAPALEREDPDWIVYFP